MSGAFATSASAQLVSLSQLGTSVPGFKIAGNTLNDQTGISVCGAGDVNGDGLADLIIGATGSDPAGVTNAGVSYVVFGKTTNSLVDLKTLGTGGFRIVGALANDYSGTVSAGGDINGDGFADLIVAAPRARGKLNTVRGGVIFVVFGKASTTDVNLGSLGSGGIRIEGFRTTGYAGRSVSSAGDVNGDGLSDLIIGADGTTVNGRSTAGETYVVFGKATNGTIDLSALGTGGFAIQGAVAFDQSGFSVSGAGDVNGDGLADLLVGAQNAEILTRQNSGAAFVVFGKTTNTAVDLAALNTSGFRIDGLDDNDHFGKSVRAAGDVNNDGLSDLIIGAPDADFGARTNSGETYVIFGKASTSSVNLAGLGGGGFRMDGISSSDTSGISVAGAGDWNGDGLADLIIGAPGVNPGSAPLTGEAYLLYGKTTGTPLSLSALGTAGIRIGGIDGSDTAGTSVAAAGDVNGDGLADLIIGAPAGDPLGTIAAPSSRGRSGESYVLFSSATAPASGVYKSNAMTGNAPRSAVGITGDGSNDSTPDSRCWIDFPAGNGPGLNGASLQTVTLYRGTDLTTGIPGNNAKVAWQIASNRTDIAATTVTLKYTDAEIASLTEASLVVYQASALTGVPWSPVSATIDTARNQISFTTNTLGFFTLSDSLTTSTATPTTAATPTITATGTGATPAASLAPTATVAPTATPNENATASPTSAFHSPTRSMHPTPTLTPTHSPTPSHSPTRSMHPTPTPTPTHSPTPSHSPTRSMHPTPTPSPTKSPTPSHSPTRSMHPTPTPSPTKSPTPSHSPTRSMHPTPTPSPTKSPTPSHSPTRSMHPTPTLTPTRSATPSHSPTPTVSPTHSAVPTHTPSPA